MRACPLYPLFTGVASSSKSGGFARFGKSHGNGRGKGGEFGVALRTQELSFGIYQR